MATKQTIAKAWRMPFLSLDEVKWRVHDMNVKLTVILTDMYNTFFAYLADLARSVPIYESTDAFSGLNLPEFIQAGHGPHRSGILFSIY